MAVVRYFVAFGRHMREGNISGGYLVIAMDKPEATVQWALVLDELALEAGFKSPKFEPKQIDDQTWLVLWCVAPEHSDTSPSI